MPHRVHSLRWWVAIIITVSWVVSFVLDILIPSFEPHLSVTTLMLGVAGWLFGGRMVSDAMGKKAPDDSK